MTRTSTTHTWVASSAATYKTSVQPLSDMLNAVLTKTGDTGQVVWANVTTVPGTAAIRDFEVFRFTDTLQATAPIFVRVDYVITNAGVPNIRVTTGTGTDGAGVLTGTTTPIASTYTATATVAGTLNAYASSDGSYLTFAYNLTPGGTGLATWGGFVIERFRAGDGTATADGLMAWVFNTGAFDPGVLTNQYSRVFGAATQQANEVNPSVMITGATTMTTTLINNNATAFPFYGFGPFARGASQALLVGYAADFPRLSEITLSHYGKAAKFLPLGNAGKVSVPAVSSVGTSPVTTTLLTTLSPLLRWE